MFEPAKMNGLVQDHGPSGKIDLPSFTMRSFCTGSDSLVSAVGDEFGSLRHAF